MKAISPECKIVAETDLFTSVFTDGLNGKGSSKADTNYQLDEVSNYFPVHEIFPCAEESAELPLYVFSHATSSSNEKSKTLAEC